ncbi:hypothetical protein [Pseudomonas abietaniphila]|uniref:Uncharacterized protein n=1 Tax=Pseudomonas abietaniphila TaxID=89065 RepID=A0A1G8RNS0_9PSED|nr:hypothetical protein [Pseudomonas abietaniphila]SDJ18631.1 hypothetical protein SAMN05216605_1236 [Pseudomonas abietaniphila]
MEKAVGNSSKPTLVSLVQLFICSGALMSCAGHLYVWMQDFTSQDSRFFTSSVTALSAPFGLLVALFWRTFHVPAKRAISSTYQLARPILQRLWNSRWYHFAVFVLCSYTACASTSLSPKIIAVLGVITSLLQLFKMYRGSTTKIEN